MATSHVVGSVTALWRFPLKSMRGERLEQAEFTERGLVGDRAYALIDADTGKVVSAKSVRLFPDLFGCQAALARAGEAARSCNLMPTNSSPSAIRSKSLCSPDCGSGT